MIPTETLFAQKMYLHQLLLLTFACSLGFLLFVLSLF